MTGLIVKSNLKPGSRQACKDDNDLNHKGQNVGEGVYCTPNPNIMESYSGTVNVGNKKYKVGLMLRVDLKKVRMSASEKDYWVVSGTKEDVRPYGILLKEV